MTPYRTTSPPPDDRRAPPVPWYATRAAFAFTSSISAIVGAAFLALAAGNAPSVAALSGTPVVLDPTMAWDEWAPVFRGSR